MSLYNVVLLSIITAIVGFFLHDQHERSYIITSVFILLCVTITLCLVFVPKVGEVAKDPRSRTKLPRPVVSNIKTSIPSITRPERTMSSDYSVKILSRIKDLTNENNILKSNAMKVCITIFKIFLHH